MPVGYRMSTGESEQLHLWLLFAFAMQHRAPVKVSFFETIKDPHGKPVTSAGRELFKRTTRTVEPHELVVTKLGNRVVKVVDRAPENSNGPAYRSIRLDRVVFSRATGQSLARVMTRHGYLCRSLLDGKPLHGTKRQLTAPLAVRRAARLLLG